MKPNSYLVTLRQTWPLIVIVIILGGIAGLVVSIATPPVYSATAKLYFTTGSAASATDLNQGTTYAQGQIQSFAEIATTPSVLNPVIETLGLDTTAASLASSIETTTPPGTTVLELTANASTPTRAAALANAVAASVSTQAQDLAPKATGKFEPLAVSTVARAAVPTVRSSPDTTRNLLAGLIGGIIGGAIVLLVAQRAEQPISSTAELTALTDAPLLETIGRRKRRSRNDTGRILVTENDRKLAVNIAAMAPQPLALTIVVCGPVGGEGTTSTVAGLAGALAEQGTKVIAVDANFRRPALAAVAGVAEGPGLVDVLTGPTRLSRAITKDPTSFDVLQAGMATDNPGALIASPKLAKALTELGATYDVVIIDSAPVGVAADALVLGRMADGAIVVVDSTKTIASNLVPTLDSFTAAGIATIGTVLNRLAHVAAKYSTGRRRTPKENDEPAAAAATATAARSTPTPKTSATR